MSSWTPATIVRIDEEYDRARASNGSSRLGAYLDDRLDSFHEWDEPDTPVSAEEFAAAVWEVATSPMMSPGYVRTRADLGMVRVQNRSDGDGLLVSVAVPVRHGALKARLPFQWREWERDRYGIGDDDDYPQLVAPEDSDRPAVLITAEVRAPLVGPLHTPTATRGRELHEDAKAALRLLVDQVNAAAGPIVATMNGEAVTAR